MFVILYIRKAQLFSWRESGNMCQAGKYRCRKEWWTGVKNTRVFSGSYFQCYYSHEHNAEAGFAKHCWLSLICIVQAQLGANWTFWCTVWNLIRGPQVSKMTGTIKLNSLTGNGNKINLWCLVKWFNFWNWLQFSEVLIYCFLHFVLCSFPSSWHHIFFQGLSPRSSSPTV